MRPLERTRSVHLGEVLSGIAGAAQYVADGSRHFIHKLPGAPFADRLQRRCCREVEASRKLHQIQAEVTRIGFRAHRSICRADIYLPDRDDDTLRTSKPSRKPAIGKACTRNCAGPAINRHNLRQTRWTEVADSGGVAEGGIAT